MTQSLATKLAAARRNRFVGRTSECDLVRTALAAKELPFALLYLFGAGGVGKTTLLQEFLALARQAGLPTTYLDSREIEPSPATFITTLQHTLGRLEALTVDELFPDSAARHVLALDNFEALTTIERWLRGEFFPNLPETVFVIIASRLPPVPEWRSDPGWQGVMRVLPLRNLSQADSRTYLLKRQIPTEQLTPLLEFTRGHPLALSLVADALAQRPDWLVQPDEAMDVIHLLVERFVQDVPSAAHRLALDVCAMVRTLTETLLAELLDSEGDASSDAYALFDWLRSLSFIESSARGLFPHDLAREALSKDLHWRNPDRYTQLQQRAHHFYTQQFGRSGGLNQQRLLSDYLFLFRDATGIHAYFQWQETGALLADRAKSEEDQRLLALIERHEGADSARIAAHWLGRQPQGTTVLRDVTGTIRGLLLTVALAETSDSDRRIDPAVAACWDFLTRSLPLRSGQRATLFRFWLAEDSYQNVSPIQSRIFFLMMQHYLATPNLAYTFIPCADPDFWAKSAVHAKLKRIPAADFNVAGRPYGVFGQDWRTLSPLTWLSLLTNGEEGSDSLVATQTEETLLLSEEEFADAVRDALRDFSAPNQLRNNPLLRSGLLRHRATPSGPITERIALLLTLLQETATLLQNSPKQISFYRVLHHTYFQPAATQEQAAELLDLPFSTYRRHLRSGIEFVTQQLWQQVNQNA